MAAGTAAAGGGVDDDSGGDEQGVVVTVVGEEESLATTAASLTAPSTKRDRTRSPPPPARPAAAAAASSRTLATQQQQQLRPAVKSRTSSESTSGAGAGQVVPPRRVVFHEAPAGRAPAGGEGDDGDEKALLLSTNGREEGAVSSIKPGTRGAASVGPAHGHSDIDDDDESLIEPSLRQASASLSAAAPAAAAEPSTSRSTSVAATADTPPPPPAAADSKKKKKRGPGRKASSTQSAAAAAAAASASASPAPRDGEDALGLGLGGGAGDGEEQLASDGTPLSQLRGESRGRKKMEGLPPSRAREVQRAFRARRAAHLATLEDRILELEGENAELRRLLALPLKERQDLGSGPTGRGKSLKEGGVPMSERVRAKRERDRLRQEAAARAAAEAQGIEYVPPPRIVYSDDDEMAMSVSPAAGSSSNHRGLTESPGADEDASKGSSRRRRTSKSADRQPRGARQPSMAVSDGGTSIASSSQVAATQTTSTAGAAREPDHLPAPDPQSASQPPSIAVVPAAAGEPAIPAASAAPKADENDFSAFELWLQAVGGDQGASPAFSLDLPSFANSIQSPAQQPPSTFSDVSHQQASSNAPWMALPAPHPPSAAFADNNPFKTLFMAAVQADQQNPGSAMLQAFANAALSAAQSQPANSGDERMDQPDPGQAAVMANIERLIKAVGISQAAQNGFQAPATQPQQQLPQQRQANPQFQQDFLSQLTGLTGSRPNANQMQQHLAQPASSLPPYLANLTAGVLSPNFPDGHPPNRYTQNGWNQQPPAMNPFARSPMNFDFAGMGFPMAAPAPSPSPRHANASPAPHRSPSGISSATLSEKQQGKRKERSDGASGTVTPQEGPAGQPDLLQRLRYCCHLSDLHVANDPGILLFASRLCLAVSCPYNGGHTGRIVDLDEDAEKRRRTGSDGQFAAADPSVAELQERYMNAEPAWQLLKSHLEPASDHGDAGLEGLSGPAAALAQLERASRASDGQNQINTGRLAAEMIIRAVMAKAKSGQPAEAFMSCRRAPGLIIRKDLVMSLVNGF